MSSIVIQGDTSGSITVEAPSVAGTHTLTLPKATGNIATDATVGLGMKNLIINGDIRIDQRNAGSAITSHAGFAVDRYRLLTTAGGSVSLQQSTDAPEDASYSLKFTVTTGATPSSGVTGITQSIEGNNVSHLKLGTANAKTLTLSFWVKASVTGTYSMSLMNGSANRFYVHEYTINSANTWEKKTLTLTGDTSGTWAVNTTTGFRIDWNLGSDSSYYSSTLDTWFGGSYTIGSTNDNNLLTNTGATWQISLVQLEVGENATPFENRMYGTELALCQRYYEETLNSNSFAKVNGYGTHNGQKLLNIEFKATKRATPTVVIYDGASTPASNKLSTFDVAGTRTDGQTVALVQKEIQHIKVYGSNGTHSGIGFYYTADAEL